VENFEELREKNVDGSSIIVELQDDVYLTVNPPKASGKHVTLETIKQQLIDKQISSPIDFDIVKKAVEMFASRSGSRSTTPYPPLEGGSAKPDDSVLRCSGEPIKISNIAGEKVKLPEIRQEKKQPVPPQDRDAVRKSSVRESKKISKIARKIKGNIGMGDIDITISEDEMEAYITVHSPPKKNKAVYIIEQLKKKKVVYGIDEEKIFDIIRNNLFQQQVMVARGKAPIEGKNAALIYNFEINREKGPKIEQKGNIDYYYLDSASYVRKNQVLVEKTPPVPAEMGISVKGNRIEPECPGGEDVPLPADKNTVISEDGTKLIAAIDGYLYFSDGKIKIGRNYMVARGDVDASIGKIDFQGNVLITGNVLPAFAVEAYGDIEIQGYVHEASLNSKEDNVIIHKDIYKSNVEAIGDIRIKMAKESVIYAKGNVIIDGDLLNCVVMAGKDVFVNGEKGIVGGTVIAGAGITANSIGSPDGVPTIVKIVEKDSELFLLEYKIKDALEGLDRLTPKLTTNTQKELLFFSIEEYMAKKRRVHELKFQKQELLESRSSRNSDLGYKTIRVIDTIYDGITIQIGEAITRIKQQEPGAVFFREGNFIEFEDSFILSTGDSDPSPPRRA